MTHLDDVYVGAETGLLKCVRLRDQNWSNFGPTSKLERSNEILGMCWSGNGQDALMTATRSGRVVKVDLTSRTTSSTAVLEDFVALPEDEGGGKLIGFDSVSPEVAAAATKGGRIALFRMDGEKPEVCKRVPLKKNLSLRALRVCPSSTPTTTPILATGGLNEHLKLWDINRGFGDANPKFIAKNVRNDWLNLKVRTCVEGIVFIPDSDKVVTCTGYHQVRVYDPTVQRRPVLDFTFGEHPLKAIDIVGHNKDNNHVIVGNTRGEMSQHDLRMNGRQIHVFKGLAGAVRDLVCHPTEPLVASCGLDRFLRVHNTVNHRLTNKVYLKSRLNKLLFRTSLNVAEEEEREEEERREEEAGEGEEDEVWGGMEEVGGKEEEESESGGRGVKRKAVVTVVEGDSVSKKKIES